MRRFCKNGREVGQGLYDKDYNTATWLSFEKSSRECVAALRCTVCVKFQDQIVACRNFNPAYIYGSENFRTSSVKDHATSTMHRRSMLLKKANSTSVFEHAPIARSLCTLDPATEQKVKKLFDIAYLLCKENLPFTKMQAICDLEVLHGVDLGSTYKNRHACTVFVEFIAQDLVLQLRVREARTGQVFQCSS